MRILLATYWSLPHVGGVWSYIDVLRRKLEQEGHQIDIFCRHPNHPGYYLLTAGQVLERSALAESVEKPVRQYYRQYFPKLDAHIVEQEVERSCFEIAACYFGIGDYDLLHTHDVISTRALWRVKPADVPLIATIHGNLAIEYLIFLGTEQPPTTLTWQHMYLREYFGAASSDRTIVPTHWLKRELSTTYGVPVQHLTVIPYGMETERFQQKMSEATDIPPTDKKRIICPARLVKVKGHTDLLDALALLRKRRSDWVCWLVGDGDQRKLLEQKVDALSLAEDVHFLGNRNDVPALLKQADIFVLPSKHDTLPYAVMEAQLAAKPIVVSDAGGLPEMVQHEQTGLLYRRGQIGELCSCLERLLADEVLRRQLAINAQQWGMRQWSLNTMLNQIKAVYEQIHNTRGERNSARSPALANTARPASVPPLSLNWADQEIRVQVPPGYSLVDQAFLHALLERG